ncbi:MAG: SEL1-like repeat protein, partial [Lachnospiraceae bacterium]|nr:SEL1-like repeat protein [Candidatus Equihabitans merdae]
AWEKADFMVFDDEADGVFKSAEALVKRNITEAKNAMGICYFHGIGTDPDKKIAMKWFEEAADLGNADGQYNIGLIYQYTLDVTYTNKSISWFEKAAEQGHLKAQKKLIKMYEYTGRAFTNLERADYWKKRMAAEHKDQHEESDWKLRVAANVYRENKDWDKNKPVLEFKDSDPFLMLVTDTVGLSRGTALGGTVIRGTVAVGDIIECPGQDENPLTLRVDGITMFNKRMPMAYTGMEISMLVNPVNTTQNPRSIIVRGSLLAWPGSLKTCTSFKAHIKRNDKLLLSCGKSTKPNTRYLTPGYPMSLEIFGMGSRMVFLKEIIGKDSIAFGEDAEVVIEAFSSEAPLPIERGFDFVLRERKRDLSGVDISIIGEGYCL